MLGLVLIYFVGKAFFDLARKHGKNGWVFAILGIVSYYGSQFLAGIVIAFLLEGDHDDWILTAVGIPVGILTCWATYTIFKRSWSASKNIGHQALDSDLIERETERYNKDER